MAKTTFVFRNGQLVEKPKPQPPVIELLPIDPRDAEMLETIEAMRRQVFEAFSGVRLQR